jgi:predicted ATP-grasp superfamily ATP-dependent carboligase
LNKIPKLVKTSLNIMSSQPYHKGIIVNAGKTANVLGVIRDFGKRGIPVILIDSERHSMARYSRYISHRLPCQSISESETEFTKVLLDFASQLSHKTMIIPTGDTEVLDLAKNKKELERYYQLPVSDYKTVRRLVNKKEFYKMLMEMNVPHPKTYFPKNEFEVLQMGKELGYPHIIKPVYSSSFQREFRKKCFLIQSFRQLSEIIEKLKRTDFEIVLQAVIPGNKIYAFYTYLNRESQPLVSCGWDKIRHYPPDFGSGSFCRSNWRPSVVAQIIPLLQAMGYHGFAAPEVIRDPSDGKYKLLEINARTILQNRLAAACGVDIEYTAYLDLNGGYSGNSTEPRDNVFWIDDINDFASWLILFKRGQVAVSDIKNIFNAEKVHSILSGDDPVPLIARVIVLFFTRLKMLCSILYRTASVFTRFNK